MLWFSTGYCSWRLTKLFLTVDFFRLLNLSAVLDSPELFVWFFSISTSVLTLYGPLDDVITTTGLGIDFVGVTFNGDMLSKIH